MIERDIPAAVLARKPSLEQQVREILDLPPEWSWYQWSAEGNWGVTIKGGVAPPKTRGKNKGKPNWRKATMLRSFTIPDTLRATWLAKWEADTGYCFECDGTGARWAGWSSEIGTTYRPCVRCAATGLALIARLGAEPEFADAGDGALK